MIVKTGNGIIFPISHRLTDRHLAESKYFDLICPILINLICLICACLLYYDASPYQEAGRDEESDRHGGGKDSLGKKPHDDNLWQMVRYCENISAYRMMQQLQYFEFFFDEKMRDTKCDKCQLMEQASNKKVDIMDLARSVLKCKQCYFFLC